MEEVDRILIQTLRSIGCQIGDEVTGLGKINQELFVECVAKILNTINPSENLPIQLPPNTGLKFRICTKFANLCQTLGYKNEIGYQTFLYSNEPDMRRLLMFLVEKLPKDNIGTQDDGVESGKKGKNLNALIAQKLNLMLEQCWTPSYCKQNSLRFIDQNTILKEGCRNVRPYQTVSLAIPSNYAASKNKYSKDQQRYYDNNCQYVTNQITRQAVDLISSLMKRNEAERIKEQQMFSRDLQADEAKKQQSQQNISAIREAVRESMKQLDNLNETTLFTYTDLMEIEFDLRNNFSQFRNYSNKGSRFAHIENLQHEASENQSNTSIFTGSSEQKKEEEIQSLKETLQTLTDEFAGLDEAIRNLTDDIAKIEKDNEQQAELNKKLEESFLIKRKTVNLIQDAPKNIQKLKDEIENFDNKMQMLEITYNEARKPYDQELKRLQNEYLNKKQEMQLKLNEIKQLKDDLKMLLSDLGEKTDELEQLSNDYEALRNDPKATQNSNRQFYTKRILEIVANIEKQKREIDKVLIETKGIQKEINQLSGKLERIFNSADELIFKDAKKDESVKKAYKLFINLNENYEQLIKTIEETGVYVRETRDLEDQVESESQNNIHKNMESLISDYKQIKEENEIIMKANKSPNKK